MLVFVPLSRTELSVWAESGRLRPRYAHAVTPSLRAAFGFGPADDEDAEHTVLHIAGLAALLHVSALAFHLLKLAGAAYMLYLAWATWRERGSLSLDTPGETGAGRIVLRAVLMNVLNPKLTIFFLAYLPQFIVADAGTPLVQMLGLSAVFMAMTLAVFVVYGLLAHAAQRAILGSPHVLNLMQKGFAAVFASLGINLALSDR